MGHVPRLFYGVRQVLDAAASQCSSSDRVHGGVIGRRSDTARQIWFAGSDQTDQTIDEEGDDDDTN
ncbi:MAG: hypothetical protein KDB26_04530 [Microthrixaceae bacterium]|nr:hypothetical protein [Microthrixaceae bacterium]